MIIATLMAARLMVISRARNMGNATNGFMMAKNPPGALTNRVMSMVPTVGAQPETRTQEVSQPSRLGRKRGACAPRRRAVVQAERPNHLVELRP